MGDPWVRYLDVSSAVLFFSSTLNLSQIIVLMESHSIYALAYNMDGTGNRALYSCNLSILVRMSHDINSQVVELMYSMKG